MGGQFGANGAMMANAPIERGADLRDGRESDEAEQYRDGDSQHGEDLFSALPLDPGGTGSWSDCSVELDVPYLF